MSTEKKRQAEEAQQRTAGTETASAAATEQTGGEYRSPMREKADSLYDTLSQRDGFRYDPSEDALYRQYRQQYLRQGERAMRDTVGAASALTGGYGNSYAATAGSEAYGQYLSALNDRVPELYDRAAARYETETDRLRELYALSSEAEQRDYDRWRDAESAAGEARTEAARQAEAILQQGYMPSDELLERAGISAEDAYVMWYAGGQRSYREGRSWRR